MEASVSAEPVVPIPSDAPVFAPLSWTMRRDQARRALTADGWRRDASRTEAGVEWFDGQLFGHSSTLAARRGSTGRLNRVVVFVSQDQNFSWERSLWDEVTGVLVDGYGPPLLTRTATARPYGGSTYCTAFELGGENVRVEWSTLFASMVDGCQVAVFYDGPGWPESVRTELIADARAADRTCRAEVARLERDRNRLAPGVAARPLPPRTARLPPAPG